MATSRLPLGGAHGGEKSIWLHNPCLLVVPMVQRNQYGYTTPSFSGCNVGRDQYGYIIPAFFGCPWWGEINGYITPVVSGGQRVGAMAKSDMRSRGSQRKQNQKWLPNTCRLGGPKLGGMATTINMAISRRPSQGPHGGERSIWPHHRCLLGVPVVGRNQHGYINPALLRVPNTGTKKWEKMGRRRGK